VEKVMVTVQFDVILWLLWPVFLDRLDSEIKLNELLQAVISETFPVGQPVNGLSLQDKSKSYNAEDKVKLVLLYFAWVHVHSQEEAVECHPIHGSNLSLVRGVVRLERVGRVDALTSDFVEDSRRKSNAGSHNQKTELEIPDGTSDSQELSMSYFLVLLGHEFGSLQVRLGLHTKVF
jgi:hypothetical protein